MTVLAYVTPAENLQKSRSRDIIPNMIKVSCDTRKKLPKSYNLVYRLNAQFDVRKAEDTRGGKPAPIFEVENRNRLSERASCKNDSDFRLRKSAPVFDSCLLYTSPSPRDRQKSRMPSSA